LPPSDIACQGERGTKQEKPAISLRRLAEECGVSLSVLAALHKGRSRRVDYATFDRLLNYFSNYFSVTMNDLLVWESAQPVKREPYLEGAHV